MADTKERIMKTALRLFAESGFSGTSMNDIATELGITKGALYKHYSGKQDILDSIVKRMEKNDCEGAEKYGMPNGDCQDKTPLESIYEYSVAQFKYWTEDEFASDFRKMLTLEQYRLPEFNNLYHAYLATGPVNYMADIFKLLTGSDDEAMQAALDFYGPMFLLYSVYDGTDDKDMPLQHLKNHIEKFIKQNNL